MLSLSMNCIICKKLTLQVTDGSSACYSIFPKTEEKLFEDDYQRALLYMARHKKVSGRYKSLIDFFFCELFPQYQHGCFKYYKEKGPRLKHHPDMTPQNVDFFDTVLSSIALPTALIATEKKKKVSWSKFISVVYKVIERSSLREDKNIEHG